MTTLATIAFAVMGAQSAQISDFFQKNFDDVSFTARKKVGVQKELAKINKDFGHSYRFEYTHVKLKEPMMLRLDSKVDDANLTLILNGPTQLIKIPAFSQKTDLSRAPGRRQTPLDFGILTPSMFQNLFVAKFVRVDRASGDHVFDLTFVPGLKDTSRHRIWIDKEKKYISKREWYNQHDRQLATFLYESPKFADGMWFATRLTVKNMDNKVAGVTEYENVKINSGLSDSLFKI